jgi:hypothetical protein
LPVDHTTAPQKILPSSNLKLRTDIAAVGALAHNAVFTAFGAISSHRHLVPPTQKAARGKFTGGPTAPHVLYPELMNFYLGTTIANRHADGSAPDCYCNVCEGLPLDRFTTKAEGLEQVAVAHNIAIMSAWHQALSSAPVQPDPRESWRRQCATAADKTVQLNTELRITTRKAFPICPQACAVDRHRGQHMWVTAAIGRRNPTVDVLSEPPCRSGLPSRPVRRGAHLHRHTAGAAYKHPDTVEVGLHHQLARAGRQALQEDRTPTERCELAGQIHPATPTRCPHNHKLDVQRTHRKPCDCLAVR